MRRGDMVKSALIVILIYTPDTSPNAYGKGGWSS